MSAQRLWRSAMRSNGFDLFGVRRGGQRLAELGCEHRATHFREGMAPVGGTFTGGNKKTGSVTGVWRSLMPVSP